VARPRILLADDHQKMRDFLTQLLEPEFEIVGAVADGRSFLEAAQKLKPDLCLLDISMPIIDGIKAAAQLKGSGSKTKILVLTVQDDEDFVRASFNNGASGYVIKSRIAADLIVALKEVLDGRRFLSFSSKFDRSSILNDMQDAPLDGSPL
jgi:DNA-binding NarL/FixJ family response regulator